MRQEQSVTIFVEGTWEKTYARLVELHLVHLVALGLSRLEHFNGFTFALFMSGHQLVLHGLGQLLLLDFTLCLVELVRTVLVELQGMF